MDSNRITNSFSDIIIVGAGPAGATASMFLSGAGIRHSLIDKAIFPRDKICGDALSGKVLPVLKKLNPDLIHELLTKNENCIGSKGIVFGAPNGNTLDVPFRAVNSVIDHDPGFVSKRIDFDYSLIQQLNLNIVNSYRVVKFVNWIILIMVSVSKSDIRMVKKNFQSVNCYSDVMVHTVSPTNYLVMNIS